MTGTKHIIINRPDLTSNINSAASKRRQNRDSPTKFSIAARNPTPKL